MESSRQFVCGIIVALVCVACANAPGGGSAGQGGSPGGGTATSTGGGSAAAAGQGQSGGSGPAGGANSTTGGGSGVAGAANASGGSVASGGAIASGGATSGGSGTNRGGAPSASGGAADAGASGEAGSGDAGGTSSDTALTAFYLDVSGRVMATDVEKPLARTIVASAGQGPDGIALDLEQGHIYWTGMGVPADNDGFVRRSDLDGSNVRTIVAAGGTYTPKQLRLDKQGGKLYWSDREGMRVMRSNLDGSGLETLVTVGTTASERSDASNWCVGIALDLTDGYFYWSQKGGDNGHTGSLRRARLAMPAGEDSASRSDIQVLFAGLPEPIDIDIDLENRFIYWTDRGDDTINRAPLEIPQGATATNRTDRKVLVSGVREAIGVTLDVARGKLYFTGGTGGRVGMANLDGSNAVNLLTGTAALTGIVVVALAK